MAINLATKFSPKVDERFVHQAYTEGAGNKNYDWTGVKTIKVYSVGTAPMGNYSRSGSNRYGSPTDLGDAIQEMSVTQDRAFTFVIDKGDDAQQMNIKGANRALQRQIDEVVVPEVDEYRIKQWIKNAGVFLNVSLNANNSMSTFDDVTERLDDAAAPRGGRVALVTNNAYKLIKQNPQFVYTDKAMNDRVRGEVGEIDGIRIVRVPSNYFPTDVAMLVYNDIALLKPMQLKEYHIHTDAPGISGNLVEGRLLYDAFVLDEKSPAVIVVGNTSSVTANATVAANGNITVPSGGFVMYTIDGSDPRTSATRVKATASGVVTHTSGDTIKAVAYNGTNTVGYSAYVTSVETNA